MPLQVQRVGHGHDDTVCPNGVEDGFGVVGQHAREGDVDRVLAVAARDGDIQARHVDGRGIDTRSILVGRVAGDVVYDHFLTHRAASRGDVYVPHVKRHRPL